MQKNILIAESQDILRSGLKAIFTEDPRVGDIYVATTYEEINRQLQSITLDLVVINQSLIIDIATLPRVKIVILTHEPSKDVLYLAHAHGAYAYLMENVSAELLRTTLDNREGTFLIDPTLTSWIITNTSQKGENIRELVYLTPREKEIVNMLSNGLDRTTIANTLCISNLTLKTHIKNIARKHKKSAS